MRRKLLRWKPIVLLIASIGAFGVVFFAHPQTGLAASTTYNWDSAKQITSTQPDNTKVKFNGSVDAKGNGTFTIDSSYGAGCTGSDAATITVAYNNSDKTYHVIGNHITVNCGRILVLPNASIGGGSGPGSPSDGSGGTGGTGDDSGSGGDTPTNKDATLDCGAGSFNWAICPFINLAQGAAEQVDGFITNTLNVDVESIFDTTNGGKTQTAYYTAWNSFRLIATAVIVIAGLVMVSAQALGFEIFGAYTIRKVLPRLIIAIVGISLSWLIMEFIVGLFDTIGFDIRNLIYAPFSKLGGSISVETGVLTTLGVGAAALVLGVASLTLILTALLAVFVGFLILVIRQLAIVVIVIIAPFAIACYALPNTQKVWKLWYDNFLGLMLMFPIVSAFIAVGHVFAAVSLADNGQNAGSNVAQIIGIAAYFAPYFLLPVAFRLATGVIGTVAGFVNDRHRGAFDRLKGVRQNAAKTKIADIRSGNRFHGGTETNLRGRLNRALEYGSNINKAGYDPRRMRSNMRTALQRGADDEVDKFAESHEAQAIFGDDAKVAAARYTNRDAMARELVRMDADRFGEGHELDRENAITEIIRAQRATNAETFQRARVQAQAKTGTGYQNPETGEFDAALMMEDINEAYGDDRNGAGRALAKMRSSLVNSGQIAGQAGFGTWAHQLENVYRARNAGNAEAYEDARQDAHNAVMMDAANSIPPSQALYGKPSSARAVASAHYRNIQAIARGIQAGTHTEDDLSAAMASAAGIYDAMAQASPQNASAFANELMGRTINAGDNTSFTIPGLGREATIRDYVQYQMNGNKEFVDRRHDFGAATYQQAQQERARQAGTGMPNGGGGTGINTGIPQ